MMPFTDVLVTIPATRAITASISYWRNKRSKIAGTAQMVRRKNVMEEAP